MVESLVITLPPVLFLSVLIGSGAVFRSRNIDMDGEPPINKALFLSSKYAIVLLWAAIVMQGWGVPLSFSNRPAALRAIALGAWIIGFALLFAGRFRLGSSFRIGVPKERTGLSTGGLFRLSRNPMYLGVYATLLAVVLYTVNPLVLLVGAYVVAVHHQIIRAEEAHLRTVFGEEYGEYCRQVRRYL
jgi:protein-S-isoprenylcysteine O-methyltransferase Ste14